MTSKNIVISIVSILVLVGAVLVTVKVLNDKGLMKFDMASANSSPPPMPKNQNSVTKEFVTRGVTNCADKVNIVTNFLSTGGKAGVFIFSPNKGQNEVMSSASLEITGGTPTNKSLAYSSASFAPNSTTGCSAVYDAVMYWPNTCENVLATQYKDKKLVGKLQESIGVVEINPVSRVFLMPAGAGCVSIKKEVIF